MNDVLPKNLTPELETSDKKPRTIGLIVVLVVFGIFGTWAAFAPLDSASLAPGVVEVKGKRKTVQHFEGGIVRDILVSDGEHVEKGDPVVVLDDTQFSGELGVLKGQYYSARALESRLVAERDDAESVEFPPDIDSEDARAKEAKQNQREIFKARFNAREGEESVLKQQIAQLRAQIEGLEAQVDAQNGLARSFEDEIEDLSALLAEGFVEKTRVIELKRNLAHTLSQLAEQKASMAQTKVKIAETELEILQLNKRFKTEVVDQLATVQDEVFDLQERIRVITDRVERTVIKAPVAGRVLGLSAHTIGGVIQAGEPILDIVPEEQELIISAKVSPADIDRVEPGLEANIRFSAFQSQTTPSIKGRLVKVAADRLVDEESGAPYYSATVEVSEQGYQELQDLDLTLVAGMPADVLIKTGERTLLQYLTQPARNAMARSLIEE